MRRIIAAARQASQENATMMPIYEMMMQAGNGQAARMIAAQYGLSERQVADAMAAFAPAFSSSLKRETSDPMGLGRFMKMMSGDGAAYVDYFDDVSRAFDPMGVSRGNEALGQLFHSKDVSRALAQQAAANTGLGQEILKAMLPVLANMVLGGLFKQSTGGLGGGTGGGSPFGRSSGGANPMGDMFGQIIEQMMRGGIPGMPAGTGGGSGRAAPEIPQSGAPFPMPPGMENTPWGKMLEQMMGGASAPAPGSRTGTRQAAPEPEPAPDASVDPDHPGHYRIPTGEEIFGPMFDTGREVQENYRKSVESVFDSYLKGMKRG